MRPPGRRSRIGQGLLASALAAGVCLACAGASEKPPPVPAGAIPAGTTLGTAAIVGRAAFEGTPAAAEAINLSSDPACRSAHEGEASREDLVVAPDGALRYVFVHVAAGLPDRPFAPPDQAVPLDQRGCVYRPHVVGVQMGQPVLIVNSDPTLHNVHTVSQANKPFNFGMAVKGQKATRYFSSPEVMIRVTCDVHPWMVSFIGVAAHPFHAVTEVDGAFALEGLPAGTYVVDAWHEKLGTLRQTVTVSDGQRRSIAFSFQG